MTQQGGPESAPSLAAVEGSLARFRRAAGLVLLVAGLATLISTVVAALLAFGMVDYLLRLPAWFRLGGWVAGVVGLIAAIIHWVIPALRFHPSLTELALRLERSEAGRRAGLSGVLASGLELASRAEDSPTTRAMAGHVVQEAAHRFAAVRPTAILNPMRLRRALLALALCAAGALAIGAVAGPRLMKIGTSRILTPWAGAQWPKRTELANATKDEVHALGTALPLRVAVTRTDQAPTKTRVAAKYRLIEGQATSEVKRVLLTGQGRDVAVDGEAGSDSVTGELYERLIEPGALAATGGAGAELEYWFETDDDATEVHRIKLVPPPAVLAATMRVTPPEYATSGLAAEKRAFLSGKQDLGPGNDQRAVVGPVLAGSAVDITVTFNKPIRVEDEASGEERAKWLASMFPGADFGSALDAKFEGAAWTLSWTAAKSVRVPISPRDEYGLVPADEAAFAVDVIEDRPPTATVTDPREDEAVLATAAIDAAGEGRDDVGLSDVSLKAQPARPARGSIGAAAEASGDATTLAQAKGEAQGSVGGAESTQATVQAKLDLSAFSLKPGDELWLTTIASDNYNLAGVRHEPVVSSMRKLRIVKEEEFVDQVRAELSALRKIAIRLDEEQAELHKATRSGAVSSDERRRQNGLTQRIQQQSESARRLNERVERNRLNDDALSGMLTDVNQLLSSATSDSDQAGAQLDAAAKDKPDQNKTELTPEQQERATQAQESVRDQLARLAEILDRGEDTWLASRNLQRLIQQQQELMGQTQRAGERTMGKKAEDLTPQERAEMNQLAERQKRLADTARQAIDSLGERSKQMEKVDAAQAQGMKDAAERGRQQQVPQKMDEAARNVGQNQTSSAEEQQQQAMDSMQQMLQDMQEASKKRDASLRRVLTSIAESLEKLIHEQDTQVAALAAAIPAAEFTGLDAPMISLNQNTLAVADKARGDRQTARIAELIDRAAKAQTEAIKALRVAPVNSDEADKGERESLRLLRLAKAEAQRLEDEARKRDEDRKRQELKKAYREALELQIGLKGETDPFIGKPVDRRDRMKVRGLGERQDGLRASLEDLRKKTEELADARVFDFAHERLDQTTGGAAKKLRAGQPDRAVERNQQSAIRVLKSLVDALNDQAKQDDDFRDDENGGGGGGGGGQKPPLIPPLAELRLLREMQQEVADLTRAIDDSKDPAAAEEIVGLGQFQRGLSERGQDLVKKLQEPDPKKPTPAPEELKPEQPRKE